MFFIVFISRVMSFVSAWIIIVSSLRHATGLKMPNIYSVEHPEKLFDLTFCFFDKPYSFKPFTIESPRIITFFLGSLFLSALLLLILCVEQFLWCFVEQFQVVFLLFFLMLNLLFLIFKKNVLQFSLGRY